MRVFWIGFLLGVNAGFLLIMFLSERFNMATWACICIILAINMAFAGGCYWLSGPHFPEDDLAPENDGYKKVVPFRGLAG